MINRCLISSRLRESHISKFLSTYWTFSQACFTAALEDLANRLVATVTGPLPLLVLEEPPTKVGKEKINHQNDRIFLKKKFPGKISAWFQDNSKERGKHPEKDGKPKDELNINASSYSRKDSRRKPGLKHCCELRRIF